MEFKNMFTYSARILFRTLTLCVLGALVACSSDDEPAVIQPTDPDAITFTTNINAGVNTRAANGDWTAGDEVGIFMLDASDEISADHHKANYRYKIESYTPGGSSDPLWKLVPYDTDNNLYYPVDGSNVHFTAYYPYVSTVNKVGNKPGTYSVSLGDQSNTAAFDLLYHKGATNYKKGDGYVPAMEFKHKLSKVVINIKLDDEMKGNDDGATLLASLGIAIKDIPTSADFDLAAGTLSKWGAGGTEDAKGSVTTVALATPEIEIPENAPDPAVYYKATYEAIIVPHSSANEDKYPNRSIEFTFKDPDGIDVTLVYGIPDTDAGASPATTYKAFSSEKKTVYVFTLKREKVEIENVSVVDWEQDGDDIEEDLF